MKKLLALILILAVILAGCSNSDTSITMNAQRVAEKVVKKHLKSPGSAVFPTEFQKFYAIKEQKIITVEGVVDSQNGFGALLRSKYTVKLKWPEDTYDWDKWEVLEENVFE